MTKNNLLKIFGELSNILSRLLFLKTTWNLVRRENILTKIVNCIIFFWKFSPQPSRWANWCSLLPKRFFLLTIKRNLQKWHSHTMDTMNAGGGIYPFSLIHVIGDLFLPPFGGVFLYSWCNTKMLSSVNLIFSWNRGELWIAESNQPFQSLPVGCVAYI